MLHFPTSIDLLGYGAHVDTGLAVRKRLRLRYSRHPLRDPLVRRLYSPGSVSLIAIRFQHAEGAVI